MGVCCNSNKFERRRKKRTNSLKIEKSNLSKFKKRYYNETSSSVFASTTATSNKQNYKPEIYTLNKFGIQVKSKQKSSESLKFIFHLYNFKGKLLIENSVYILQIIFDGKEFPLSFGKGINPSFVFDETFGKEITFEKMSNSFLEIYLYKQKQILNNTRSLPCMTKGEILAESEIYSCLKINLLTIALAPKKHDFVLIDPKRIRVQLGRISYCISCNHISDLNFKIHGFRINLNNLKYNEIALKLKFENRMYKKEKESTYTNNFKGIPNNKENLMIYESYDDNDDDSLNEGLSEDSSFLMSDTSENFKNSNDLQKYSSKNIISNNNIENITNNNQNISNYIKENEINDKNNYNENKLSDKLQFHGDMCINDLFNSEITINIYSVRLQNKIKEIDDFNNDNKKENEIIPKSDKIKTIKKDFFMKKLKLPDIAIRNYNRKSNKQIISSNLNLINSYELIGVSSLNFYIILHELESKLHKISYRFFQSMSYKKNDLVKTFSGSKIMKYGIEKELSNKAQSNNNLLNINNNEFQYKRENLNIKFFQNENLTYKNEIYCEGELLGNIEINLEITNLPLIRQIKFGVMTETGFELNSIFLYDNLNISNDLPEELLELIKLKENFKQEIDFSILKNIKICLEKTIEENFLYYGYSSNEGLFQGQAVIIDLGLGLFNLLDKVNFEYLQLFLEILKLILSRSEIDLSTLSARWFKPRRIIKKKDSNYYIKNNNNEVNNTVSSFSYDDIEYEFNDNYLVEKHLIEKFLNFHLELLEFCLNNLNKGNNISKEIMDFTYFYLARAFVKIPLFRDSFIKIVNNGINLKDEKYLKFSNHNFMSYAKNDFLDNNPNYNIKLYDSLFYKRLDSSINIYIKRINDNNNTDNKNTNGMENINAIKEQLMNIKYITEIKEEKNNNQELNQQKWYTSLSKRDFVFYDLLVELFDYMNIIRYKTFINQEQTITSNNTYYNNGRVTHLYGIRTLVKAINYDLLKKDVKCYPRQIKEIIPLFYADISIINNFISIMLSTTNVYDTISIFCSLDILDYLFNKKYQYAGFKKDCFKYNIDYNLIKKAFFIIINSDNSLTIAKVIWFYYKNISILSHEHIKEIITSIITTLFFKFFFHWSFQVREIFYYFIIFILGYKLRKQINPKKNEESDNNIITHNKIIETFHKKISFNFFTNFNEDNLINESKNEDNFNVEDFLKENMDIISEFQKIVKSEPFNLIYMDNIEQIINKKNIRILDKIPDNPHGNIIECIRQYDNVFTRFNIWKKNIEDNHITEDNIEYPKMEISMIKDDTIEYES